MDEIKLGLKDGIRNFVGQWLNDDINESVSFHFTVLNHLKETSPD